MKATLESNELYNILDATSDARDEAVFVLKKNAILLRAQDASNTYLYSAYIPDDAMEEYSPGEHPKIGFNVEKLKSICPSNSNNVTLYMDGRHLCLKKEGRTYKTGAIDPDTVEGHQINTPDINNPVTIKSDMEWFSTFTKEAENYVYSGDGGAVYISAREGAIYLWSRKDDDEIVDYTHWEDFDEYGIEWNDATPDQKGAMGIKPQEEKVIESIIDSSFANDIQVFGDDAVLELGCGMPLKAVTETEPGVKHSWIIPPRYPTNSQIERTPESVIEKAGERETL